MSVVTDISVNEIRKQFPILNQEVNGKPLIYFDNAATSQTPQVVIDALVNYYQKDNANIHRGIHTLAERATTGFEATRKAVHHFINSNEVEEIVFTKGTSEGINLVAQAYGRKFLKEGDEVLITGMEHHSNIVPWQMVCEQVGATLKVIPVDQNGEISIDQFASLLSEKTKIVSAVYISNSLGTINPVPEMIELAHKVGAKVLVDAAQAAPHHKLDVQKLNCDWMAFSAHKMYGPTGVGVLYGKRQVLEKMDPYQGGGEMIREVTFNGTTYNDIPYKFEAGTPNIADVVAFKAAIEFMNEIGFEYLHEQEQALLTKGKELLFDIDGFQPIGTAKNKASVISFLIDGVHPFDLGMWLDAKGIAVRTGHHCTQPLMDHFNIEGTVRASFAVYNTVEEIERFAEALTDIVKKFRK
ncbi:aminotransferase class V-fold PLP-dependent enzyme [Marinoscillum pacificum]|uniref:aminotransferase class V-fold PLP-dependent enzyme n=1 Tax=Marinoscillum pacificum TaxID=392723 RepID=UPI00280B8198|nr:cysteine desulfurase [Marinoscillum pacificum]